jgi:hypothetical protein
MRSKADRRGDRHAIGVDIEHSQSRANLFDANILETFNRHST